MIRFVNCCHHRVYQLNSLLLQEFLAWFSLMLLFTGAERGSSGREGGFGEQGLVESYPSWAAPCNPGERFLQARGVSGGSLRRKNTKKFMFYASCPRDDVMASLFTEESRADRMVLLFSKLLKESRGISKQSWYMYSLKIPVSEDERKINEGEKLSAIRADCFQYLMRFW